MCSDFILFGPLYVSFLVFNCFIHSIRVWLLDPNALRIIIEGHRSYVLCVIWSSLTENLFITLWVFSLNFILFYPQINLLYALFLIFVLFFQNHCLLELEWIRNLSLNLMFETVIHFCQVPTLSLNSLPSSSQFDLCYYYYIDII